MKNITKNLIRKIIPKRNDYFNKNDYGKVLVVAGSYPMPGAAYLSSKSALKSGCGLLYAVVVDRIKLCLSAMLPEAIFYPYRKSKDYIDKNITDLIIKLHKDRKFDVLLIGPGLGNNKQVSIAVVDIVRELNIPTVVDADALNAFSSRRESIKYLRDIPAILTPHKGEAKRFVNTDDDNILLNKLVHLTNSVIVLKNYRTLISDGKEVYSINKPNSALSKGGSGDVLSGLTAGLLAQSLKQKKNIRKALLDSAVSAVWLHSRVAELLSKNMTKYSVMASDLIDNIFMAFKELK
jgi:hydroxyethylthiazole kinase-like uncharacterized protein yjeF